MNFPTLKESACPPSNVPTDPPSCSQPALVIKPAISIIGNLEEVQFATYLRNANGEVLVASGLRYSSSNPGILAMNAYTGRGTGVGTGVVTVSATWNNLSAFAQVTVLSSTTGCDDVDVAMLIVLDDSKSLGQIFDATNGSKLNAAKALANEFSSELNQTKDSLGFMSFNETVDASSNPDFTQDPAVIEALIAANPQTNLNTSMGTVASGIAKLTQSAAQIKVLVLFSDGQDTVNAADIGTKLAQIEQFKSAGGIVICVGIRAYGDGFQLLGNMATGGFFLNAVPGNFDAVREYLSELKGFFCAGGCNLSGAQGYGVGCTDSAAPSQMPDPNPLFDIELGTQPTVFTSTKEYTAHCPAGTGQSAVTAVPVMTSATLPTGVVTDSGTSVSGHQSWQAFGGTGWQSTGDTGWIVYQFPAAKVILGYALTTQGAGVPGFTYVYTLAGSNDGVAWTDLFSSGAEISTGETAYRTIPTPASYLYYRLSYETEGPTFGLKLLELFEDTANTAGVTKSATRTSTVSQADADTKAMDAARIEAESSLVCFGNAVSITDLSVATPYPASYRVTGFSGSVAKVTVTVKLKHDYPSDVTIVVVNPYGTGVVLLRGTGNGHPVNDIVLVFDQTASALAQNAQIVSGTCRPTSHSSHVPPAPCPQSPGPTLNAFIGVNPNGVWLLYVDDTKGLDNGRILEWSVTPTS